MAMALGATFVPGRAIDVEFAVIGASWAIGESLASRKEVEAIEDNDCAVINPDVPEQAVHVASIVANQNLIYRAAQNITNTQEGLSIAETMKRCLQEFEDCDEHIKESDSGGIITQPPLSLDCHSQIPIANIKHAEGYST